MPASWNEQYSDLDNYTGMAWYLRQVSIPSNWQGERIYLRVGSANYFARVWVNGVPAGEHLGGHLPFSFEITEYVHWGELNTIAIQVENHLTATRVPAGHVEGLTAGFGTGYPSTTFDFFPYAGINRPVVLYSLPQTHIEDITVVTEIEDDLGIVTVTAVLNQGNAAGKLTLSDPNTNLNAELTFKDGQGQATIAVPGARLWSPEDPHLYQLQITVMDGFEVLDLYTLDVGIRTIEVRGKQLLLNGEPVFLKGFGRHEDFFVHGKGLNLPLLVKDYSLLKWIGANSYRTSHYPYSEEEMQMADRQGMLIIDEIPAVSLQFNDSEENIHIRLEQCKQQIRELVARDKNHPSVIMWSIANEPMPPNMVEHLTGEDDTPLDPSFTQFFNELYGLTRSLDPTRLVSLVGIMGGPMEWLEPSDVVCINRYWGWYTQPGQPELGARLLSQELDSLYEALEKPIIVSEFGADTIAGMHSQPARMWTEEYQVELLRSYLEAAATKDFVVGMHVWNFADFRTPQSTTRIGGMNLKGAFTRDRQPKMAAHLLRERWTQPHQVENEVPHTASQDIAPEVPVEKLLNQLARSIDGKKPGLNKTLKFDLGESGIYRLLIVEGRTRVLVGDGEADAAMKVKLEDAIRIFTDELDPMVAVMTGKVKLSGDAMAFLILQE